MHAASRMMAPNNRKQVHESEWNVEFDIWSEREVSPDANDKFVPLALRTTGNLQYVRRFDRRLD